MKKPKGGGGTKPINASVSFIRSSTPRAVLLEFPDSNDGELVMDILRYGPDVEVLGPASLRRKVRARLEAAAKHYR